MTLTVHHLDNSRSQRVLWLLEELGVPYDVRPYQRDPKTMHAPDELRNVHPLGKSPVVTDGDVVVAETGAIIEYIIEQHGNGRLKPPAGTPALLRWRYWLHFAEGSAMPWLLMKLVFDQMARAPLPEPAKPVAAGLAADMVDRVVLPNVQRQLDFIEAELSERAWFAGDDFSAADIQMSFPLEAARQRAGLDERRPATIAWLDRIHARPAYARAIERGGPYRLA